MSDSLRPIHPRIPPIGATSPAERMFRVNWVDALERAYHDAPVLPAEFVVHQGRNVRIVDVRPEGELLGPQGYIPGADWLPGEMALELLTALPDEAPVVLVSREGELAAELAKALESKGKLFVAAMLDGMIGWRHLGFATTRNPEILSRAGRLRDIVADETPPTGRLTLEEVERHVGDPFEVRWVRMAGLLLQGRHHCVDGRDDRGVCGTPGGDAGELLVVLTALERILGRELDTDELERIFAHVLDAFGAFYMHTDTHAQNRLIEALRADPRLAMTIDSVSDPIAWRRFFANPPEEARDVFLEHLLRPAHVGCGHIRLAWENPTVYGIRSTLVAWFLKRYFEQLWLGATEIEYARLAGEHDEAGVLSVRVDGEIFPFTQIPLVAPACHGKQMFVSHPQVATHYRRQVVELVCREPGVPGLSPSMAGRIADVTEELASVQTAATLSALAAGLPIFEATFHAGGRVSVRYVGDVPSPAR